MGELGYRYTRNTTWRYFTKGNGIQFPKTLLANNLSQRGESLGSLPLSIMNLRGSQFPAGVIQMIIVTSCIHSYGTYSKLLWCTYFYPFTFKGFLSFIHQCFLRHRRVDISVTCMVNHFTITNSHHIDFCIIIIDFWINPVQ